MFLTQPPEFVPRGGALERALTASNARPNSHLKWRRWRRGFVCLLILAVGVYLVRAPLLGAAARVLVCDEHSHDGSVVLILGGDRCYRDAVRLYDQRTTGGVLLFERPPGRLERLGVLPSPTATAQQELTRGGVPSEKIEVMIPTSPDDLSLGSAIAAWQERNSTAHLVILCDAFSSRSLRWGLNRELSAADATRVHIWPLTNRRYDEQNWWRTKEGMSALVRGWLALVLPILRGQPEPAWQECTPELFRPEVP